MINDDTAPHSLEPQFRKLGMSTSLLKGVPTLTAPHTVCKEGDTLNPNQVNLLKLFGKTFATVSGPFSFSQTHASRCQPTQARERRDRRPVLAKKKQNSVRADTSSAPPRQFQIVPLLGIHLTDGSICGGSEEATTAAAMADDEDAE